MIMILIRDGSQKDWGGGGSFLICFQKKEIPRKEGGGGSLRKGEVPTLEETI